MVERECSQSVSSASLHVIQRDVDEPRRHGSGPDSDRLLLRDLPLHVVPPRVVGSASRRYPGRARRPSVRGVVRAPFVYIWVAASWAKETSADSMLSFQALECCRQDRSFPSVAGALPVADNPTTETVRFPLGRALLENFDLHLGTSLLNVVVCRLSRHPRHFM